VDVCINSIAHMQGQVIAACRWLVGLNLTSTVKRNEFSMQALHLVYVCMCSATVKTKFSRYDESSDSDECHTSDSESSSTDDDANDDDVGRTVLSKDDSHPTDADVDLSLADGRDDVNGRLANISERSPVRHVTDAEGPEVPTEQVDLPTVDSPGHPDSPSHKSDSSSSSSNNTPPSPIRAPLSLQSTGHSLSRWELRKDVPAFRYREQTNTRRPAPHKYESSSSPLRPCLQSDAKSERSPLRTADSFQSNPATSSSSTLERVSHPVSKTSPYRHSVARGDRKPPSPFRPRSQERQPASSGRSKSRSHSSERRPQSPPRSRCDDGMNRRKYSSGNEYSPRPLSHSRSPSAGKSPARRPLRYVSPHRQTSQSRETDLPRSSRSRSSSRSYQRSGRRSRSRGRSAGSSRVQSPSESRSHSPVTNPFHRQRSRSVDRRSKLPASSGDGHFARHTESAFGNRSYDKSPTRHPPAADPYKNAARRRSSRSLSTDRALVTRYPRDVSPPPTAESDKTSVKYQRSYSRSPDSMEKQAQRTDAKLLPRSEFLEKTTSRSRSSSRHRSQSPRLSDRRSPRRRSSPSQRGMNKANDNRQESGRYQFGRSTVKPKDGISGRLPDVRERLSRQPYVAQKRSISSDRNLASRRRLPDIRPTVHNSPVLQRHSVRTRSGRSPQRTNEMIRSRVRKRFSPSPPDSASIETKSNARYRPDNLTSKLSAKSEEEPRALARNKYSHGLTDSQLKHPRMSPDLSEDSSLVERQKRLAEPDKSVQEQSEFDTESTKSPPHQEQSHVQESSADDAPKGESAASEAGKTNSRKALTLKRPAAPVASVLEARKRRFEQMRNSDSRSVCIRPSSEAKNASRAKFRGQLPPLQLDKSKLLGKGLKEVVDRREVTDESKGRGREEKAFPKMQTEISEFSDLTSADSSVSLEDISEDETPRVQGRHFGEQSSPHLDRQRAGRASELGKQGVLGRELDQADDDDDDDAVARKSSTVSSIVKAVKKDTAVSRARHSATRHSQSAVSEAQSITDDSYTADDDIVSASKRNIVNKG